MHPAGRAGGGQPCCGLFICFSLQGFSVPALQGWPLRLLQLPMAVVPTASELSALKGGKVLHLDNRETQLRQEAWVGNPF